MARGFGCIGRGRDCRWRRRFSPRLRSSAIGEEATIIGCCQKTRRSSGVIETEVLIVGSGPAGSSAGLMLSTYGIPNIIVTKYGWLADTPRAHLTNQRAMEILRDLGIEADVAAQSTPQHLLGNTAFCTSLAGEELGRLHTFG